MASMLSLKLLVDKKSQKVLFAEAEKGFVDFLFSLLALPVGTVFKLLKDHSMVGSIGKLYQSVENLNDAYIQPGQEKNMLLNPICLSLPNLQNPPLLPQIRAAAETSKKFYVCSGSYHHSYVTDVKGVVCPCCTNGMTTERSYVASNVVKTSAEGGGCGGGLVKGVVTYTVRDDLVVTPMSSISIITLLSEFKVKDVTALEEQVVEVGMKEGLSLLKASLHSKTVLTDVFLRNKVP